MSLLIKVKIIYNNDIVVAEISPSKGKNEGIKLAKINNNLTISIDRHWPIWWSDNAIQKFLQLKTKEDKIHFANNLRKKRIR